MDVTINKSKDNIQSCVITTGVSSLNYYIEHMESFEKNNSLLYNYMKVNSIKNIAKADEYKLIIEFSDSDIKEIVFELLDYLLPFYPEIYVKVIYDIDLVNSDAKQCMTLLNRLNKHKLINLEIITKSLELPKEKPSLTQKIKKIFIKN